MTDRYSIRKNRSTGIRGATRWILFCLILFALLCISGCGRSRRPGTILDFNDGWLFMKGELDESVTGPNFDDSGWEEVRLPHDWAIAGPFDPAGNGSTGKLPWKGAGWYRKTFDLDPGPSDRRVYFDFDGVMAFPKVYVNGNLAGEWDYGYSSFRVDATPYVKFDEENVIAVMADTRRHRSRWYPGAGIYRKVTLTVAEPVHIAHWGAFVTTPVVTDEMAAVQDAVTVENHLEEDTTAEVSVTLNNPDGVPVADGTGSVSIPAGGSGESVQAFDISNPERWDVNNPELYTAKIDVSVN